MNPYRASVPLPLFTPPFKATLNSRGLVYFFPEILYNNIAMERWNDKTK